MTHLNLNRIINFRQFGYQKGIGTSDAIDNLVNDIINKLNDKIKVAGLFIDLSSAFDTLDHELLLAKLEHYGIRGKALKLLASYLKNRRMYVEIKDINAKNVGKKCVSEVIYKSKMTQINRGVPQGSILGPILFIIFTVDLLNFINNIQPDASLVMFADDTNAIIGSSNLNELSENVNKCLKNLSDWFTANNLIINPSKTNVMLFKTTTRNNDSIDVTLKRDTIKLVNEVKFLGVYIDSLLNWKKELTAIDSSISSACYALRSLRDDIDIKQLKAVYYALVESRLRYSIMFWGSSYEYNCQRAFVLQKRALRTIVRIPQEESCKEYFKKLGILTVPSLYVLVLLSHFAKYIHEHESQEEREFREKSRRNVIKNKIAPKLTIAKHCSKYQSVELFNKLPTDLRSLIYKGTLFKAKLKAFLLHKCLYSISELVTNDGK